MARAKHGAYWTAERRALLRKLWSEGVEASAIARKLGGGCTKNAVIGKAHRMELPPHPHAPYHLASTR